MNICEKASFSLFLLTLCVEKARQAKAAMRVWKFLGHRRRRRTTHRWKWKKNGKFFFFSLIRLLFLLRVWGISRTFPFSVSLLPSFRPAESLNRTIKQSLRNAFGLQIEPSHSLAVFCVYIFRCHNKKWISWASLPSSQLCFSAGTQWKWISIQSQLCVVREVAVGALRLSAMRQLHTMLEAFKRERDGKQSRLARSKWSWGWGGSGGIENNMKNFTWSLGDSLQITIKTFFPYFSTLWTKAFKSTHLSNHKLGRENSWNAMN